MNDLDSIVALGVIDRSLALLMDLPLRIAMSSQAAPIRLYGVPFSTFTRSIKLGYRELHNAGQKGKWRSLSEWDFIAEWPHSAAVSTLNPFGLLPVLELEPSVVVYEAAAIREWIDQHSSAYLSSGAGLNTDHEPSVSVRVAQWISLCSSTIFRIVEHGVIKPRLAKEKENASEEDIKDAVAGGLEEMNKVLSTLEELVPRSSSFVLGTTEPTWADLFLYPILADLKAIPEVSGVALCLCNFEAEKLIAFSGRASARRRRFAQAHQLAQADGGAGSGQMDL